MFTALTDKTLTPQSNITKASICEKYVLEYLKILVPATIAPIALWACCF
ncbi:hypothetical protein Z948_512 [Sulfitobacter donghicola DSW-25 = KCTC 12864 = JCM 14565]|nr:hypothetical protein Z948_512 [Sulfitobacter donghicola DSW-25 = KCTC 12864 = JCM 14565]